MANLLLSIMVAVLLLGGPITLFALVKILNSVWGGLQVKFLKSTDGALSLLTTWDNESFDIKITRVKLDYLELVPGGRSLSESFTFEDSSAQKKSFLLPLSKLPAEEMAMLTDSGAGPRDISRSTLSIEVETLDGETRRFKVPKKKILAALSNGEAQNLPEDVEVVSDKAPDSWSVQTRVFPWKKKAEADEDGAEAPKKKAAAAPGAPRAPVDFIVTKVWIEPGCIVCDACEAEAPAVFWVQADTCIVRENAPLDDAAAIKAAAEGCPVDVIKYTKAPKAA